MHPAVGAAITPKIEMAEDQKLRAGGYMLAIRMEFARRLEAKTGWGRNEVLAEFDAALRDVMAKIIDSN